MTRARSIKSLAGFAMVALIALGIAACGSSSKAATTSSVPPSGADGRPATIGVANSSLGKILVNRQGRTLYMFQKDSGGKSTCFGACAANWPPLRATGMPTVGSGADASLATTTKRSDGAAQVTYNGHPVYLFAGDKSPGDTNGQGVNAFGGGWFALSPAGGQVSNPAPSTGGGGY